MSVTSQIDIESTNANLTPEKKGTADDQRDMFRMGKHQELRVGYPLSLHTPSTNDYSEIFDLFPYLDFR